MTSRSPFERLEAAYHRLVELDPSARRVELAEIARQDTEIHATLARLLARDETADARSLESGAVLAAEIELPLRLGPYLLEQRLGAGGMGEVFAACQEEPIQRRVAIKLVRSGLGRAGTVARFHSERQAVARMSHPGIAQIFDAGTAPDGRPYFVMELVEGEPITTYCDRRRLPIRRRLELFAEICDAVHHAHQKGILHRDLKPSNILITELDGRPMPKIIDFGIAKALETPLADATLTHLGEIVGTLEYMSPEQAAATNEADTRSDVYSLGAVLYQLLVGEVPLPADDLGTTALDEVVRRIRQHEPLRPSARLQKVAADSVSGDRATDSGSLRRTLRRDLDWIVMKALDKQPERRYPSASELAADVRRQLADEPVLAGPPSTRYRLGKLVRRHRVAVAAATAVLLALVAGVLGTTVSLVRAQRAEREARREAATSERVSDFLSGLFRGSEPGTPADRDATARDLLERGLERLRTELTEEPVVRARLLATLGDVLVQIGDPDQSIALLEEAREAMRREIGARDPALLDALVPLARAYEYRQRFDDAEAIYREALEVAEGAGDEPHGRMVGILNNWAGLLLTEGRSDEALALAERGVALCREICGPSDSRLASLLIVIGSAREDPQAALEAYDEALAITEESLGSEHFQVGIILNNMAVSLAELGRMAEGRDLAERSLAVTEAVYGPVHPRVADRLINLALADPAFGELELARDRAERAIAIVEKTLGPEHRRAPLALIALGTALVRLEEYDRARAVLADAMTRAAGQRTTFEGQLELWATRVWAEAVRLGGDPKATAEVCRARLAEERLADLPGEAGGIEAQLALALAQLGRHAEASSTLERAVARLREGGAAPSEVAMVEARLAARIGDPERSLERLAAAVESGLADLRLAGDPDLADLRNAPRFADLVERVRRRVLGEADSR